MNSLEQYKIALTEMTKSSRGWYTEVTRLRKELRRWKGTAVVQSCALVLVAMLLFATGAWGQDAPAYHDDTMVELGGDDSLRVEALGFTAAGQPSRVVMSAVPEAPFEFEGATVVRIIVVYDVYCGEGTLTGLRYVLVDVDNRMTRPIQMPYNRRQNFTPDEGSTLDRLLDYVCKQRYETRVSS